MRRLIFHHLLMFCCEGFGIAPRHPPCFSQRRKTYSFGELRSDSVDCNIEENGVDSLATYSQLDDSIREVSSEFFNLSPSIIRRILAKKGLNFKSFPNAIGGVDMELQVGTSNKFEKVTGCVSNVYIRTVVANSGLVSSNSSSNRFYVHHIEGISDAIVSRGILSCVSQIVRNSDVDDVLNLHPATVADRLGLRPALTMGRNDGLASMIHTIQKQVRHHKEINRDNSLLSVHRSVGDECYNMEYGSQKARVHDCFEFPQVEPTEAISTLGPSATKKMPTVALLLSGGVDSSVALRLLVDQGYNVTAFYLKIWLEDELSHLSVCPWDNDYQTCVEVCDHISKQYPYIQFETISLQEAYQQCVVQYAISEAKSGRTPNPDILCNARIKFGCFYDAIKDRNFDYIATGHYARVDRMKEKFVRLLRAPDPIKDQSYFLCALSQDQLERCIFPIGHLLKAQVRELATLYQLPNRDRRDSQGLCFLGKLKFDQFLEAYLGCRPGPIEDATTGEPLGRHNGIWFHTVGQRKGIGNCLTASATSRGPWYVVAKDPSTNTLFCSNQYDDDDSFAAPRKEVSLENIQWIAGYPPKIACTFTTEGSSVYRFKMKVRHGPKLANGTLRLQNGDSTYGEVMLDEKDGGLAPGQYIVLYNCDDSDPECYGAGIISEKHWTKFLFLRNMSHSVTNVMTSSTAVKSPCQKWRIPSP